MAGLTLSDALAGSAGLRTRLGNGLPALAVLMLSLLGCDPKPRVSPWGTRDMPPLGAFVERPDLARSMAAIDTEARATGLRIASSARVEDRSGTPFVVLSLVGQDRLGNATSAARVASPWGVVLALGPAKEGDDPRSPTELVAFLEAGPGRSVKLPADLTGDGSPEIVVEGAGGAYAIYALEPQGTSELASDLPGPLRGIRPHERGYALFGEEALSGRALPLAPSLSVLATFENGRFSSKNAATSKWHAGERDARDAPWDGEDERGRLTRLCERAWHAAQAGDPVDETMAKLDATTTSELGTAWEIARKELRERLSRRSR
jgi:hypothetical protein